MEKARQLLGSRDHEGYVGRDEHMVNSSHLLLDEIYV